MADNILVPYDGSAPSNEGLKYAFETFPDAEITAYHVVQIPDSTIALFEGPEIQPPVTERAQEHAETILESAHELAAEHGRDLETEFETGKPAHRIVERATEGGYDTVVIGSHGREGPSRILLGSVAEDVVRRAPVPVVVVR